MKPITEHEIISHGVENSQGFQGCGTAYTAFEDVAAGIGDTEHEAFEDALESLAQAGWDVPPWRSKAQRPVRSPSPRRLAYTSLKTVKTVKTVKTPSMMTSKAATAISTSLCACADPMKTLRSISLLHTLQMLVRQHGGECAHFNGWQNERDAFTRSHDSSVRVYTLRQDPSRKIWLNGEHVASALTW